MLPLLWFVPDFRWMQIKNNYPTEWIEDVGLITILSSRNEVVVKSTVVCHILSECRLCTIQSMHLFGFVIMVSELIRSIAVDAALEYRIRAYNVIEMRWKHWTWRTGLCCIWSCCVCVSFISDESMTCGQHVLAFSHYSHTHTLCIGQQYFRSKR